jgi:hypothetical protein
MMFEASPVHLEKFNPEPRMRQSRLVIVGLLGLGAI